MFKHRLLTGIISAVTSLLIISIAPWWILPLFGLVIFYFAITEFHEMLDASGLRMELAISIIFGLTFIVSLVLETPAVSQLLPVCCRRDSVCQPAKISDMILALSPLIFLCAGVIRRKTEHAVECFALSMAGLWYTAVLLSFMFLIVFTPVFPSPESIPMASGRFMLIYLIILVKMGDIGAYTFGMTMGKGGRKLIPEISPGKSVIGLVGAYVGSTVGSLIVYSISRTFGGGCLGSIPLPLSHSLILAILMATTGVMGDLAESLFKRSLKIKDSSSRFPGMGGILDILDSLLFSAPFFYIYMTKFMLPCVSGGTL